MRKLGPRAPAGAFSAFDGTHWLIENGHREVSKKAAVRYARFFRVDLDWLLTGKGVGTGVTPAATRRHTPTDHRRYVDGDLVAIVGTEPAQAGADRLDPVGGRIGGPTPTPSGDF